MSAPDNATPRVAACIEAVMRRYPSDTSTQYYVAVHQDLAPLARSLERETMELRAALAAEELKGEAMSAAHAQAVDRIGIQAAELLSLRNSPFQEVETKAPASTCWCHTCRPVTLDDCRMVLCPTCGNKRCPRANDHRHACTGSNEPGQAGSAYPAPTAEPGETPP